jgi:hypothetical protein
MAATSRRQDAIHSARSDVLVRPTCETGTSGCWRESGAHHDRQAAAARTPRLGVAQRQGRSSNPRLNAALETAPFKLIICAPWCAFAPHVFVVVLGGAVGSAMGSRARPARARASEARPGGRARLATRVRTRALIIRTAAACWLLSGCGSERSQPIVLSTLERAYGIILAAHIHLAASGAEVQHGTCAQQTKRCKVGCRSSRARWEHLP